MPDQIYLAGNGRRWPEHGTVYANDGGGVNATPFRAVYRYGSSGEEGDHYCVEHYNAERGNHVRLTFATAEEAWRNEHVLSFEREDEDGEAFIVAVVDRRTGILVPRPPAQERIRPQEGKKMIDLNVKREGGRLYLYVNAKGLHDVLDAIGVQSESAVGGKYHDRPRASQAVCDRSSHTLSTEVFLTKSYPAKFDLTAVYTEPTNFANYQRLLESGYEQARKILEHYQPIDIKVSIQKKVVK